MDYFIGGLKEEIQLRIQELKLTNLKDLIWLTRVEEAKLEAWFRRSRMVNKPSNVGNFQKNNHVLPIKVSSGGMVGHSIAGQLNLESNRTLLIKGLTREQIAEKRKKRLYL